MDTYLWWYNSIQYSEQKSDVLNWHVRIVTCRHGYRRIWRTHRYTDRRSNGGIGLAMTMSQVDWASFQHFKTFQAEINSQDWQTGNIFLKKRIYNCLVNDKVCVPRTRHHARRMRWPTTISLWHSIWYYPIAFDIPHHLVRIVTRETL